MNVIEVQNLPQSKDGRRPQVSNYKRRRITMNDNNLKYAKTKWREKSNVLKGSENWKEIDWKKTEKYVNRLQIRIVKAKLANKNNLVKRLQYLLVNSFYAKAIAVRKVTSNRGKKTAGIDKEIWRNDKEKYEGIKQLNNKTYKAKPTKRVYIEKSNGKLRPLSIPTMKDRAMQTLHLLALQPIEETIADENSYGFRLYRSCHDAMQKIYINLCTKQSAEWILEGDIKGCFDNISHEWLLKNIPMNKNILKQFINAGYVYKKQLFPTTKGAIQGGAISPTLANITLDGLESAIHRTINKGKKVDVLVHRKYKVNFVRFADDFIVTGETPEILEKVKQIIKEFLKARGLELSEEKTLITNINDGFDFLGWNFKKYNGKLIVKPSKKSEDKIAKKISQTIKENRASSQENLINKLNPIIIGWSNYHQPVCAKKVFLRLDNKIYEMIWKWAKRKHSNKGKRWIARKYWNLNKQERWNFATNKNRLRTFAETPIVRHTTLAKGNNPYLDKQYYENRKERQQRTKRNAYKRTAAYKLYSNNSLEVIEA